MLSVPSYAATNQDNMVHDDNFWAAETQKAIDTFGATLATPQQVQDAATDGASWCQAAFATDRKLYTVVATEDEQKCSVTTSGFAGPIEPGTVPAAGMLLYGRKPTQDTVPNNYKVEPWNGQQWSKF